MLASWLSEGADVSDGGGFVSFDGDGNRAMPKSVSFELMNQKIIANSFRRSQFLTTQNNMGDFLDKTKQFKGPPTMDAI